MRHDHLKRELELLLLLSQNRTLSTSEICDRLGISLRSFYYYIDFFSQAGFRIEKHGYKYSIDRDSPFFARLSERIDFTPDEALLMRRLVEENAEEDNVTNGLRKKLEHFYDFKVLADTERRERMQRIKKVLTQAMRERHKVELIDYSSPSSHTVSNRLVEPFQFFDHGNDVRCYEETTGKNKTFRLSRMGDVRDTGEAWTNERYHRTAFTDLFAFTGEETMHVKLRMGQLSHNVMLEEYPASEPLFSTIGQEEWLFQADVCSYHGIGRFVLGLYDDITIISDEGLFAYVHEKILRWSQVKRIEE